MSSCLLLQLTNIQTVPIGRNKGYRSFTVQYNLGPCSKEQHTYGHLCIRQCRYQKTNGKDLAQEYSNVQFPERVV